MKAGICCDSLEHCTPAFLLHMRMLDFYPFSYPAFYPTVLLCYFSPTVFRLCCHCSSLAVCTFCIFFLISLFLAIYFVYLASTKAFEMRKEEEGS
mmetsp:Transcript_38536/g.99070  ORF Transcript_38536/g.99070 Transcript_38536/m.99070 type:complete len:95 (+) Transcript_38536:516-800(+)